MGLEIKCLNRLHQEVNGPGWDKHIRAHDHTWLLSTNQNRSYCYYYD